MVQNKEFRLDDEEIEILKQREIDKNKKIDKEQEGFVQAIYERLLYMECTEEEPEEISPGLMKRHKAGELTVMKYVKDMDPLDVCYSMATLLFDNDDTREDRVFASEVMQRNFTDEYVAQIMINKFTNNHDT